MHHARVSEDIVEASCVERVPVMDEKSLSPQEAAEVVDQVPGHLAHPQPIGNRRDSGDLYAPGRQIDDEEHQVPDKPRHRALGRGPYGKKCVSPFLRSLGTAPWGGGPMGRNV